MKLSSSSQQFKTEEHSSIKYQCSTLISRDCKAEVGTNCLKQELQIYFKKIKKKKLR